MFQEQKIIENNSLKKTGGIPKMEYENIEPNVWKPENEGDQIEGELVSKRENVGPNESKTYYLKKDNKQTMIWGSTVLDSRMDFINVGDYIKVTFKGTQENKKGQPTKIFKVERQIETREEKVD